MKRRLIRAELVKELNERGYPLSMATMNKLCSPLVNKGPPVDSWWGQRPLYDLDQGIAWAEALLRSHRSALPMSKPTHEQAAKRKPAAPSATITTA
jgi:hypothetical protein